MGRIFFIYEKECEDARGSRQSGGLCLLRGPLLLQKGELCNWIPDWPQKYVYKSTSRCVWLIFLERCSGSRALGFRQGCSFQHGDDNSTAVYEFVSMLDQLTSGRNDHGEEGRTHAAVKPPLLLMSLIIRR